MPSPPAFETAPASAGVAALPTGACTTGAVSPRRRQNGVGNGAERSKIVITRCWTRAA
jgi:hypothetical protein